MPGARRDVGADVETVGVDVADEPGLHQHYDAHSHPHHRAKRCERVVQSALLRDIFGNPFRTVAVDPKWLTWNGGTVPAIARRIYDQRRFEDMPILADALEDAGCDNQDILTHCRQSGDHVRGCWVVALLLGNDSSVLRGTDVARL